MFCKNCHTKLPEGAVICAVCGTNNADTELTNIVTNIVNNQNPVKEKLPKEEYAPKKSISAGAVIVILVIIALLVFITLKLLGQI